MDKAYYDPQLRSFPILLTNNHNFYNIKNFESTFLYHLNQDQGRHHLPTIYKTLIMSCDRDSRLGV